nr:hypothetical protein [Alistipes onderdonkii]
MLYYSPAGGEQQAAAIGVASGPSPVGPFTDHGKLIGSDEIGVDISIDQFLHRGGRTQVHVLGKFPGHLGD